SDWRIGYPSFERSVSALTTSYQVGNQEGGAVPLDVHVKTELSINEEHTILLMILRNSLSFAGSRARSELFVRFLKVGAKLRYRVRAGHMLWVVQDGSDHSTPFSEEDLQGAIDIGRSRVLVLYFAFLI